jgi:glycosyltransferase involved in cell wall biosynthesis
MSRAPVAVLIPTRNEEENLGPTLERIVTWASEVYVLDSASIDRTREIAAAFHATVVEAPYDAARIVPWVLQWGLDSLPISAPWILILEADQRPSPELVEEITAIVSNAEEKRNGFYLRRLQYFRGQPIRFGGYGKKWMLKLFRKGTGRLDPEEQDARVYVAGEVGWLKGAIEEHNLKEREILFYLGKHLRYIEAFAREELKRQRGTAPYLGRASWWGTPDERILKAKQLWLRLPRFWRPFLYFTWRYVFLLGFLDGKNGFVFHFLQAFWFRLMVDIRLAELEAELLRSPE